MSDNSAFIIDAVRTPRSRKNKEYSTVHPVDLLSYPLEAIVSRNNIAPELIEDVITGCVTQVKEQSWCIARAAVLASGWPITIPGATINRLCGSGQQACNFVAQAITAGTYQMAIGSGVEHMTRAPMFSDIGGEPSPKLVKHHPDLVQQGTSAELLSQKYQISRTDLDQYALRSQTLAAKAQASGAFSKSLCPVPYVDSEGNCQSMTQDNTIRAGTTFEALQGLKPAFQEDGVITAGNASAIVDGAAAVLLASARTCDELKLKPRAIIRSTAVTGSEPRIMLTGPVTASKKALTQAQMKVSDIDLWEINEAFAPVPLVVIRELGIDPELVNVNGGGISLGHPLGATGAMLIGTALDELENRNKKTALITMCIGLGMGIATIIERV